MIKMLLNLGAVGLLLGAFFDPLLAAGTGSPIQWGRDLLLALGGVTCFYARVRFRDLL